MLNVPVSSYILIPAMDGCHVTVYQHLDGEITIGYGPQQIGKYNAAGVPFSKKVVEMPLMRKTAKDGEPFPHSHNYYDYWYQPMNKKRN